MSDITNDHPTEIRTFPEITTSDSEPDMTDREIALETLRLARETNESQRATQKMVEGVIAEVGPMVESFANNPALKMLGFGKKFGL